MALRFFNTLTRKKQNFKPLKKGQVSIYSCGPTVYNYAHIGNYRAFLSSDILKRYLQFKSFKVKHVMNVTDVDDKTIRDSKKEGKSLKEFTKFYTKAFLDDLNILNVEIPELMPKATECVPDMIKLIQTLLKKGVAYKAKDGIYFDISKHKTYGKLSKIDLTQTKKGKRVNSDEYDKTNPNDFALWKFWDKEDGDVFWEAEFGKGRPGWHIECSAMSEKNLGKSFDIHTGGVDLIFPHHENEIAQSEAASGKDFVKYWLHNEYILVDGKKMSKSMGNFYTLRDLLDKGYSAKAIRYLLISTHYRQQLNFTLEGLKSAENTIERIKEFVDTLNRKLKLGGTKHNKGITKIIENINIGFEEAMDDDLNVSEAEGFLFEFIKEMNKIMDTISAKDAKTILDFLGHLDKVLGVMVFEDEKIPAKVMTLAEQRQKARADKDFKAADKLRDELKEKGYEVKDTKDGFVVKKI
ncbi:cysteine--tRNA ligase [Candidatus Woesearchaeota archaeon]|jgi:cysteinyl-tRNA synthetase|nr:cysteine--tRNA ligase [Candidatus Woesearchaeota archaeon]MBT5272693.1 cysteine--tRNA ligase [Candidatus Woesearchaeota archaeon]MBT6040304.1 cysteine--tRNA ligase [Candidatus Woesearchaeota archaeon]MBT6337062.1 cysteine--tRNA ligase [Candidatus Woesearchaeota archaeon]MBT7927884.1 cysteine--tRNA ligase [Candidatus Woesearchaeota archaeon]